MIKRGSLEELERFTKMVSTDRVTFVNELESVLRMALQSGDMTFSSDGSEERTVSQGAPITNEILLQIMSLEKLHLGLDFSGSPFGNEGLRSFGEGLKALKSVAQLSVDFSCCESIGDEGLRSFGEGLKALKSIAQLKLNFYQCYSVGDEGLRSFGEGLKALKSVAQLQLHFSRCDWIRPGLPGSGGTGTAQASQAVVVLVPPRLPR